MRLNRLIIWVICVLPFASCGKLELPSGVASLTIFNAVVDGADTLRTNFSGGDSILYRGSNSILYGRFTTNNNRYSLKAGELNLGLFLNADTIKGGKPLYHFVENLERAGIYSLFLTGKKGAQDYIMIKEKIPSYTVADSATGIRFLNLCVDCPRIKVVEKGDVEESKSYDLKYKEYTDFVRYPITKKSQNYMFEFRDASTDELIALYEIKNAAHDGTSNSIRWIYKNFTLVVTGSRELGGKYAPDIGLVLY